MVFLCKKKATSAHSTRSLLYYLQIEKPNDTTTIVDLSLDTMKDFVRFYKLCAAPNILIKTPPPIVMDDADDFRETPDTTDDCRITSSECDEEGASFCGSAETAECELSDVEM